MGKKTAILFPGIGYHGDKPLLYYSRKLAAEEGYRVVTLNYEGFPENVRGDADKMRESFRIARNRAEALLEKEVLPGFSPGEDEVLLISKSVGTAVAADWQAAHGIAARNLYFTPVEATFPFIEKVIREGLLTGAKVFHGTSDPWVETEIVEKECRRLGLPLFITPGGNHSLETGNAVKDVEIIKNVMEQSFAL